MVLIIINNEQRSYTRCGQFHLYIRWAYIIYAILSNIHACQYLYIFFSISVFFIISATFILIINHRLSFAYTYNLDSSNRPPRKSSVRSNNRCDDGRFEAMRPFARCLNCLIFVISHVSRK